MPPEGTLAPTNGHGRIPHEISARAQGTLPLTRRAIAAMARYSGAESEDNRDRVQAWCKLSEPERWALDRLAGNLIRCGERRHWAVVSPTGSIGFTLAEAVSHCLLEGLALAAKDVEAFVRALGPLPNRGTELALLADLPARCVDLPPPPEEDELPGKVPGFAMQSLAERLCVLMERKGLALAEPVYAEQKLDLAAQLGIKASTVAALISRLRKEQGIPTPQRRSAVTVVRHAQGVRLAPAALPPSDLPVWRPPEEPPKAAPVPEPGPIRGKAERPVAPDPYLARDPEGARAAISQLVAELVEAGIQELALGPLEGPLRQLIAGEYPELLCLP